MNPILENLLEKYKQIKKYDVQELNDILIYINELIDNTSEQRSKDLLKAFLAENIIKDFCSDVKYI